MLDMETRTIFDEIHLEMSAPQADDSRTAPVLDTEVVAALESRFALQEGMARISAQTVKIDKLLSTIAPQKHIAFQCALKNIKRDLLVGLAQIQGGSK